MTAKTTATFQEPGPVQRIFLHLRCPCRNWRQARFHLAGILREFVG